MPEGAIGEGNSILDSGKKDGVASGDIDYGLTGFTDHMFSINQSITSSPVNYPNNDITGCGIVNCVIQGHCAWR